VRIHIIGGGSIGLLLGSRMSLGGSLVTVWTRTPEQADILNREGIRLREVNEGSEQKDELAARVQGEWIGGLAVQNSSDSDSHGIQHDDDSGRFHWLLLTVKQTQLEDELLHALRLLGERVGGRAAILCMQNGIGHLQKIADATNGTIPVFAAVTAAGARRVGLNEVLHTGNGEIWIGDFPENGEKGTNPWKYQQKMLLDALGKAGFSSFLSNEIHNRIYYKLLINSVINPLTALFDVSNGELPRHPRRLELMRRLHDESRLILIEAGLKPGQNTWEELLLVCSRTSENVSSMLSDVRNGKETEIHSINGAIISLANQYEKPAPLNRAVTDLIAAITIMP